MLVAALEGCAVLFQPAAKVCGNGVGVHAEQHTVDGLNLNRRGMHVAHFRQAPARRVGLLLFRRQGGFQFFPIGFCCGKGMVAITNRQRHGGLAGCGRPACGKSSGIAKVCQRSVDLLHQRGVLHGPTGQVAAVQHQRAIIQQRQLRLMGGNGFNQGTGFIVGQHHHMRGFQLGPAADLEPGRDARHHCALAGADGGLAAFFKAVLFQVHSTNQPLADGTVHLGALHIHIAMYTAGQQVIAVILHGRTDRRKA